MELLKSRRFLPLFLTQFCGAFNDNLFKNALVVLIVFGLADAYNVNAQILITVIAGLFILPFFLFSATVGQLADKYEKSFLIKITKITEIILMVLTARAFIHTSLWALIILLFFMGAQSTFFGPLKYSILPQHLRREELIAGNGLVNAGTYIAILLGTLCGGLLVLGARGKGYIAAGVVLVAIAGYIASLFIPRAEPASPDIKVNWNIARSTLGMLSFVYPHKALFRAMLGISWFWLLGSVFLAQFPSLAKNVLGCNEQVSTFFLILFSIGVGVGSILCNRLLKGEISAKLAPYGCIGMSASIAAFYFLSVSPEPPGELMGLLSFAREPKAWGIMLSLLTLSASGGIFSVPLYALMQTKSHEQYRARVVACLNIMDSFAMVLGALFSTLLLLLGVSLLNILLVIAVINLVLTPFLAKSTNGLE